MKYAYLDTIRIERILTNVTTGPTGPKKIGPVWIGLDLSKMKRLSGPFTNPNLKQKNHFRKIKSVQDWIVLIDFFLFG
jgi:hypothetical protein